MNFIQASRAPSLCANQRRPSPAHRSLTVLGLTLTALLLSTSSIAPTSAQITFYDSWNTDTDITFQFTLSPAKKYATSKISFYINTDNKRNTGYLDSVHSIGAEYLFEIPVSIPNPQTKVVPLVANIFKTTVTMPASNLWSWGSPVPAGSPGSGTIDFGATATSPALVTYTVPRAKIGVDSLTDCSRLLEIVAYILYSTGTAEIGDKTTYTHTFAPASSCTHNVRTVAVPAAAAASPSSLTFRIVFASPLAVTGCSPTLYLDTDRSTRTGAAFPCSATVGHIGADYRFVGARLFSWTGSTWVHVQKPAGKYIYTYEASKQRATWVVARSNLGDRKMCQSAYDIIAQYTTVAARSRKGQIYMQANRQSIAIPSYIYPCLPSASGVWPSGCSWKLVVSKMPTLNHITIFNPANGPGTTQNSTNNLNYYTLQPQVLQTGFKNKLLGYVATTNGAREPAAVKRDIDNWYEWFYKTAVVRIFGIFFDEAMPADCSKVAYYTDLVNYVKRKAATAASTNGGTVEALTILNPGGYLPECYMATGADIIVLFEDTYKAYTTTYTPAGYETKYDAMRFWHLVHSAPNTTAALQNAIKLSKTRRAGNIFVTGDPYLQKTIDPVDNPWDSMPGMPNTMLWDAHAAAAVPTGC